MNNNKPDPAHFHVVPKRRGWLAEDKTQASYDVQVK